MNQRAIAFKLQPPNPLLDLWTATFGEGADYNYWTRSDRRWSLRETLRPTEDVVRPFEARHEGIVYAFAVPCDEALDALVALGPIVEVFAGTGYWAAQLEARGGDVCAYDALDVGATNEYFGQIVGAHYAVERLDAVAAVQRHPDRVLLMVWPPMSDAAALTLAAYRGPVVAYIGEGDGGCTGDAAFHAALAADWEEVQQITIPQWEGIHDALSIYRRKEKA